MNEQIVKEAFYDELQKIAAGTPTLQGIQAGHQAMKQNVSQSGLLGQYNRAQAPAPAAAPKPVVGAPVAAPAAPKA